MKGVLLISGILVAYIVAAFGNEETMETICELRRRWYGYGCDRTKATKNPKVNISDGEISMRLAKQFKGRLEDVLKGLNQKKPLEKKDIEKLYKALKKARANFWTK